MNAHVGHTHSPRGVDRRAATPTLVRWLAGREITATHVQDLGLLKASDLTIFSQARDADVIIVTKDIDFVQLLERHGVEAWAELHEEELLADWGRLQTGQRPEPIEPLR